MQSLQDTLSKRGGVDIKHQSTDGEKLKQSIDPSYTTNKSEVGVAAGSSEPHKTPRDKWHYTQQSLRDTLSERSGLDIKHQSTGGETLKQRIVPSYTTGGSGLYKTKRQTWHYNVLTDYKSNPNADEIPAESANEKDVNTIKFEVCMKIIDDGADALLKEEFSDVGNVSIMIDSKNIVETCIKDLIADIENDVKKLKHELNSAYEAAVEFHNKKQVEHNKKAETDAKSKCTSGIPWVEENPE